MSSKSSVFVLLIGVAALLGHALTPIAPEARAGSAIEIADWHGLNAVRNDLAGHYVLVNDLDSSTAGYDEHAGPSANDGAGWEPIGTWEDPFTGGFDGGEFTVSNLFVNRPDTDYVGLFGRVNGATIENVGLLDVSVTGKERVGALVGANNGAVQSAYATGEVTGHVAVGGLVGYNSGSGVSDSYAAVEVVAAPYGGYPGGRYAGGLVGSNHRTIENSYATGDVKEGYQFVGGLVGYGGSGSGIINSYATGSVTGNFDFGGLVGRTTTYAYVDHNSFWDTETSGQSDSDGGTGKTTAEMKQQSTFTDALWTFPGTWEIDAGTYPYLAWQTDHFDFAPPVFAGGYPKAENVTFQAADLVAQVDEDATAYYVILPAGADAPGAAQVKAGTDANDSAVTLSGNFALTAGTDATEAITGLDPETAYDLYVAAEDDAGNLQPDPSVAKVEFTTTAALFAGGDGSSAEPYRIETAGHLNNVRDFPDSHFVLTADLDLSAYVGGEGWEPIGTLGDGFTGVFDGRGHVIENLFIDRANANDIGLFGSVGSGGIVTDLGLKDVDVTGYNRVGGLVGTNEGTVSRAYSIGEARVKGVYWFAGGLVGMSTPGATITDAYAIGEVSGRDYVGGLVGRDEGSVSNSYAIGSVTGFNFVGGLVGYHAEGSILRSFSGGSVSGSANTGGLIGRNEGIVHNAYTTSDVTRLSGTNEWFGGFVGRAWGGTIRNAYSTGSVYYEGAEDPENKGFVGAESGRPSIPSTYSGNYFDSDASNQNSDAVGAAIPKTTEEMTDLNTFRDGFWDIRPVYEADPTGGGYPFFSWQLDGEESVWSIYMERPSFAHGDGSRSDPYRVGTAEYLSNLRYYLDSHFVLENDIDLSGFGDEAGWEPIGNSVTPFTGHLDGAGFAIRNLSMDRPAEDNVGLLGYTESGATIVDLDLVDVAITGNRLVGALTGDARNGLRVERVSISGEVVAKGRRAGCLAGTLRADSLVEDVHVSCTMISHDTGNVRMGGFAGELEDDAVIRNSHSAAIVISVHDGDYVGGFTGEMEERAQIIGSHFSGSVSGGGQVGGLAGQAQQDNRIETSWVTGTVTGIEEVGGLVGDLRGTSTIFASYATGKVTGSGECIGGLVGLARRDAEVTDSYAQGPVTGGQYVGGLVGCAVENAAIATTYAIGAVSGMDTGGLVALLQDGATVSSSYYNSETTGQSDTGKGEPRTMAQMRAGMAYTPSETYVHWATPWNISATVNGGYAYLSALPRFTVAADVTGNGSVEWTGDYPHGATAELVLTPDEGFDLISVSGCGGSLSGNGYTTAAIGADCTAIVRFTVPDPGPDPDPDPDPKPDPEFYDDGVVSCAVLGCEAVDMGGQRWVGIEDLVIGDDRTVDIHVVRDLDDATAGVVHELTVRDAEGHALHTTRGESEVPDARTTIDRDGDEQPRVVTRVMLEDGTEVEMIALADGTATHRVILPTDEVTEAVSVVPGAKTRIRADGRVVTRSDGEHCEQPVRAVVETRADGEGVTRFEEFGILSQRWRTHSITIDDTVSRFEPGHNARIEGGACAPRLRVVTPVSRDLYF